MRLCSTPVNALWTDRRNGDLGPDVPDPSEVVARRRAVVDRTWSWLRQVHGADVVIVSSPEAPNGQAGDALVSANPEACLAVFVADCAPVALASPEGIMGAVHAGWRGLLAGVVQKSVEAMRRLGASEVLAALGACIHPECYEFSKRDLDRMEAVLGADVRSKTSAGQPALDMPRAVRVALERAGASMVGDEDTCTACSRLHFSFRARGDRSRQAMVVFRD